MAGYFLKNDFTPSTSSTYTVSFWVKINNFTPTSINVPYLWSIGQSGQQTSGLFFQGDTTPTTISFYNGANGQRYFPTNYMRDINGWYHVHLKSSSGTGTLYLNGESVKTSIVEVNVGVLPPIRNPLVGEDKPPHAEGASVRSPKSRASPRVAI